MSQSLSVKLVYGLKVYDANEESWPLPCDPDSYRTLWPDWVKLDNEDEDDPGPDDFETQCADRLIEVLGGFTEPEPKINWHSPDYRNDPNMPLLDAWNKRKRAAAKKAQIGSDERELGLFHSGVTSYQDVYLGFLLFRGQRATEFNPVPLTDKLYSNHGAWEEKIRRALKALNFELGLDPKLGTWLLANYS